jgi:hypothetical protein
VQRARRADQVGEHHGDLPTFRRFFVVWGLSAQAVVIPMMPDEKTPTDPVGVFLHFKALPQVALMFRAFSGHEAVFVATECTRRQW